jgi:hypothetical protein
MLKNTQYLEKPQIMISCKATRFENENSFFCVMINHETCLTNDKITFLVKNAEFWKNVHKHQFWKSIILWPRISKSWQAGPACHDFHILGHEMIDFQNSCLCTFFENSAFFTKNGILSFVRQNSSENIVFSK